MSSTLHPLIPPLYQTVSFWSDDRDAFAEAACVDRPDRFYTRYGNPTVRAFESAIAELEGAEAALATASGMAAVSAAVLGLAGAGDHIVAQKALYGGTTGLLTRLAPALGIEVDFVDQSDPLHFRAALRENTRLLLLETPSNPLLRITDVVAIATIARAHGVVTFVDSTLGSPANQRLIGLGADLVMHSATKYLAGHGDVLAGVLAGSSKLIDRIWRTAVILGASLDPHASFLAHRGLKTLGLRMALHNASALEIARWLTLQPGVASVHYPGLTSHPQHELACRQMPGGHGGVLSFELAGGAHAAESFIAALRHIRRSASFGSPATLAVHPAAMWAGMIDDRSLDRAGVPPSLVRLGIGLEPVDAIIADLELGLAAAGVRPGHGRG
jgi:methionine-gamma-lyase